LQVQDETSAVGSTTEYVLRQLVENRGDNLAGDRDADDRGVQPFVEIDTRGVSEKENVLRRRRFRGVVSAPMILKSAN
jgi:hypothetical protein